MKTGETQQGAMENENFVYAESLKDKGYLAFQRARMLNRTTAGRQYLEEAKASYTEALTYVGQETMDDRTLAMVATLNSNLAAVLLSELPPNWAEAKAAADVALDINPKHIKALYRRAQALLEDGRQGIPKAALEAAFKDLQTAGEIEPRNAQIAEEAQRVKKRIAALEAVQRMLQPEEIANSIPPSLVERGENLLPDHGYVWGQSQSTVHIFVPARGVRLARSSGVSCKMGVQSLDIQLPSAGNQRFLLEGRLYNFIQLEDSSWQLEDEGLLLHVELSKRDQTLKGEHWPCVWKGHQETHSPSAEEQQSLQNFARTSALLPADDEKEAHPKAAETVRRLQAMCPGVQVEWGDTSLDLCK